MKEITLVGMGPGGSSYLTMEAYELLTQSAHVFLRTDRHPVVSFLVAQGMNYTSFDSYYEQYASFDEVYEAISEELLKIAETQPVIYAVPGNPFVAEKSVSLILEKTKGPVKVVHGASFIDAIVTTLRYDPVAGFVIADALNVENERFMAEKDHLFIQVYDQMTASSLKLHLMEVWPDDHEVTVVKGAGIPGVEQVVKVTLAEMDHDADLFNHLTSVFVSGGKGLLHDIHELVSIMRTLRSEEGCPWDREQTHQSLTPYLIEEAYEVKDAVDRGDDESLVDELGDVLLQVVFHATIADEDGYFSLSDIVKAVCEKMIRRHPHVFGDVSVNNSDEVLVNWQAIKDNEKENKSVTERMTSVTKGLPGLIRAQKVQKKVADVGFDWRDASHAFDKIEEEVSELREALNRGDRAHIEEELGDLLLILSNVARLAGIDAEQALFDGIEKFINRFAFVESELEKEGKKPDRELVERMEVLWIESKKWDKTQKK